MRLPRPSPFRLIGCLLLLLTLVITPLAIAGVGKRGTIQVRYLEFPPYSFTDRNGQPAGSLIELTKRMLQQAGYPSVDIRSAPSARLYAGLADGSIHVWPGAPGVPQLAGLTLESRFQVAEVSLNLYYRADTPKPRLPEDLRGKRVILITGYTYRPPVIDWLKDPELGILTSQTTSHEAALRMLMLRRGRFLIDYETPISREIQRIKAPNLPYVSLHRLPIKLIISKAAPAAEQLRNDLDRAYQALQATTPEH